MKPLYAREITEVERKALQKGLRCSSAHTVRRSQIILMSAEEQRKVEDIAQRVGRSGQQIRRVIRAFNHEGLSCLKSKKRGRQDDQRAFNDEARARLREMIICSPREFGQDTSLWTLDILADVSYEQGLTDHRVHKDTVSETLMQMGLPWKRAKKTIHSPDPNYESKKNAAIGSNALSSNTLNGY